MSNKLKEHFPLIWEREELLSVIKSNATLSAVFNHWEPKQRELFLNFCTGVRGIKFLYDGFSKEILNPEYHPKRINDLLSLLLKEKLQVLAVLPNDSTRIADESSLIITDIVVQLEDGRLANVEVQKYGYKFPGQRSACYASDLLLRQYKRIRSEKGQSFNYKDIKDVYIVVLYEHSSAAFHDFPNDYLHFFEQQSDTGLKLDLLQKFVFIPLDIFRKIQHNKVISNKLEAWLLFFASDDPEDVLRIIKAYPEFRAMYEQAYEMCRNVEDVMGWFSEELRILDRNTVQYMIDEMQVTIDNQKAIIEDNQATIDTQQTTIDTQQTTIDTQQTTIDTQQTALENKQSIIDTQQATIDAQKTEMEELRKRIAELESK